MDNNQNIGEWMAIVSSEGKTPQIFVTGKFPTNGTMPNNELIKSDPQGINPTELLLTLLFGDSVTPSGTDYHVSHYNEAISTMEQYKTVLVVDENGRTIANINVTESPK